jgi:hypothetical protein
MNQKHLFVMMPCVGKDIKSKFPPLSIPDQQLHHQSTKSNVECFFSFSINGLRYHYQHTGPHGGIGLQLLSIGLHPSGPTLNLTNLVNNHQHRHPMLTSSTSSCVSSSQDGGSVDGQVSGDNMDVTMDD